MSQHRSCLTSRGTASGLLSSLTVSCGTQRERIAKRVSHAPVHPLSENRRIQLTSIFPPDIVIVRFASSPHVAHEVLARVSNVHLKSENVSVTLPPPTSETDYDPYLSFVEDMVRKSNPAEHLNTMKTCDIRFGLHEGRGARFAKRNLMKNLPSSIISRIFGEVQTKFCLPQRVSEAAAQAWSRKTAFCPLDDVSLT